MNTDYAFLATMLENVWCRSYSDISAVVFILNPCCLYHAKTPSNDIVHHQYRVLEPHYNDVVREITNDDPDVQEEWIK